MLFFLLTSSIGDHNEMEVDWGSDEKEVSVVQATPADTVKAEAELEGLSGEAEQNLLDLLEAQKVSNQALLARLERLDAERVTELQRQELLDMVLNRDPGFVAKLESLPTPVLLEVEDKQGMSLLHHAVRLGQMWWRVWLLIAQKPLPKLPMLTAGLPDGLRSWC